MKKKNLPLNRKMNKEGYSNSKETPYLYIGIGCLFLIILLLWLTKSDFVVLTDDQYLLFKIILALSAACLSFSFSGFFSFKYKEILFASGSFAVFLFSLYFVPELRTLQPLVINLRDVNDNIIPDLSGILILDGNIKQEEKIKSNGSVVFQYSFKEDSARLDLQADEWEFTNKRKNIKYKFVNNGRPVYINLIKARNQSYIKGNIFDSRFENKKVGLKDALVVIDRFQVKTNESGFFKIDIPEKNTEDYFELKIYKKGLNNNPFMYTVTRGSTFEKSIP